jgi:hypothetical protein
MTQQQRRGSVSWLFGKLGAPSNTEPSDAWCNLSIICCAAFDWFESEPRLSNCTARCHVSCVAAATRITAAAPTFWQSEKKNDSPLDPLPPKCPGCGGPLRPDVVLFGEMVRESHAQRAAELLRDCDVLLVLGTACDVAPAADMLRAVSARGGKVFELSLTKSMVSNLHVDWSFEGSGAACGDFLEQLAKAVVGVKASHCAAGQARGGRDARC